MVLCLHDFLQFVTILLAVDNERLQETPAEICLDGLCNFIVPSSLSGDLHVLCNGSNWKTFKSRKVMIQRNLSTEKKRSFLYSSSKQNLVFC